MAAASITDTVQQAYLAYYGRPADPAGLAFWTAQVTSAGSMNAVINAFGTSAESTALYAGASTAAQVNAIYQQLFGRQADITGLNFYVNAINNGTFTLASVALNIYNGAVGTDATQLTAKLAYADAFTVAVGQSVSAQIAYSSSAAAANARAAVAAVVDTTSEAAAQAALPTTLANIGSGTVGQTVTLTTGVDNIAPTGNSVINGVVGGSSTTTPNTLTALDKIVATGTNNTLNISDVSATGSALPAGISVSGVQTVNLTSAALSGADNFSGFTGLTTLSVTEAGGVNGGGNVTAAGTTAVTLTDSGAAAGTIGVQGGSNVSVTANGVTAGGTINVGTVAQATGTVSVIENMLATQSGPATADAINVKGGTTVTVTANLGELAGGVAANTLGTGTTSNTVTGGAIGITGTAATTTVTVNQTAAAAAANAVAATVGSPTINAVTAAAGVTGVSAVAATSAAAAKAAVAGVVDGAVTITDAAYNTANANTITSVTLSNYGAGSAINDNALANLSLNGTAGTLAINNATNGSGATPTANSTLNLTLNGLSAPVVSATAVTSGGAANITSSGVTAATGGINTITDTNGEIATLNVTTAGANSTLTGFTNTSGTGLKTLNVSGTSVLTLGAINSSLTALNVSGAAGFNDGGVAAGSGLAARGAALTITDTSSGKFTAVLDATTQTFVGSTGQDVITISDRVDATKAITAGSATNNELILDGTGGYNLTAATAKLVTGFQTVGVTSTVTGTIDMSVLDAKASALDVIGSTGITFNKVATGASISLANTTGTVAVNYVDATGASDSTTVTIGAATNAVAISAGALSLADANGVGVGTVSIVSNDIAYNPASNTGNTLGTLTDNGLSTLNVSGTGALTITNLLEATTQATSFTLNNTDSGVGGVSITNFTDSNLGSLTFTGTGNSTVGTLNDTGAAVLSISNTGSGSASIGAINDLNGTHSLTSLTLTGNVALGSNTINLSPLTGLASSTSGAVGFAGYLPTALAIGATTGVTVSGATDNAHVNINLTGAAAGSTDTITLGNGNDYITDGSAAGKVNITVGTGSNLIDLTAGSASTYAATVTLGAHSGVDSVLAGVVAANAVTANTVINGALKGDYITFNDFTAGTAAVGAVAGTAAVTNLAAASQVSTALQTSITAANTLSAAITLADNGLAAHSATAFQYGGNTYVIENHNGAAGSGALTTGDAFIQLTGLHTIGSTITNGHIALTA